MGWVARTVTRCAAMAMAVALGTAMLGTAMLGTAMFVPAASAAPRPTSVPLEAPARTAISIIGPFGHFGTPNQYEPMPGLSMVKLYMVDYVYHNGSRADRPDLEKMIRFSDDGAAQRIWNKYGAKTINETARIYHLHDTFAGSNWGKSYTSAADIATFLHAKRGSGEPLLVWMAEAGDIAADGTRQNWGTARLPGAIGSKWGWSDDRTSVVASGTWGDDFTAAAITLGNATAQTADVLAAFDGETHRRVLT